MVQLPPEKPPANYWATIISAGSLAVAAMSFLSTTNKATIGEVRESMSRDSDMQRRLCQLEMIQFKRCE
jgi:hypothetical protein